MPYVYILQARASGKYYIGSTTDLTRRLKQHNDKQTPTTTRLGDCDLIFSQAYPTLKEARYIERRLKALKRRDYLEKIVREGKITMQPHC